MKYKLVSFDLDGTLFKVSVHKYIAERLGKLKEFERLKNKRKKYENLVAEIYQILSGFSIKKFLEWMEELPKIKNLEEGIKELKKAGLKVVVLSDCSSYVKEYLKQYRFDDYLFTWEQKIEDGRISKQVKRMGNKLEVLKKYLEREGLKLKECIHVGDWENDFEVFEAVGFSILLNPKENLNVKVDKRIESEDLIEVVKLIKHDSSHF